MRQARTALLASLALLSAAPARAADPCAEDVKRLCATVEPGGGRIEACLEANAPSLSPACRDVREAEAAATRELLQEFKDACGVDLGRLCQGVKVGGGRIQACLSRHEDDLSSACRGQVERVAEAKTRVTALRDACRADLGRLCADEQGEAGRMVSCLQEHAEELSPGCTPGDPGARAAVALLERVEKATADARIEQTLEILQGLDSVAFVRSQIALQFDDLVGFAGRANANRFTFNPQFVFGHRNQFALVLKVPVVTVYPYEASANPVTGLGAVNGGLAWAFHSRGQWKQYVALGVQFKTATSPSLGSGWAVQPTYALALGLARGLSLTAQVSWTRSFAEGVGFPEIDVLQLRPIVVVGLPAMAFAALDTSLAWDLVRGTFLPVMKGVLGKYVDRQKSLLISAWLQGALTREAAAQTFRYGFGLNLAYFFDW